MITYVLFNRDTEGARRAEELAGKLAEARVAVELVDADSARGTQLAENYDVMGRPAVVAAREDGSVVRVWQSEEDWPAVEDVSYLAHS